MPEGVVFVGALVVGVLVIVALLVAALVAAVLRFYRRLDEQDPMSVDPEDLP